MHMSLSRVQLLLISFHIHIPLHLSAGCPQLKANEATGSALVEFRQTLHATILHRVLQASSEVGHKFGDGPSGV